jgi:hypothetical protein
LKPHKRVVDGHAPFYRAPFASGVVQFLSEAAISTSGRAQLAPTFLRKENFPQESHSVVETLFGAASGRKIP